ncbi:MAG: hydrogenase [Dehalococcoidia bacterium]|nr:hydrogenase [Dehalococcoidia bacterium]
MTSLLLVVVVLLGLTVLGSSRIPGAIRLVAAQGVVVAALLFISRLGSITPHLVAIVAFTIAIKGWVIPWLLFRSIRAANVQREVDPYIGYTTSLVLGTVSVGVAFGLATVLPVPNEGGSALVVPVSLATLFTGLMLLVTRKKAVTQVLGYLVMENGILVFSMALGTELPMLVEMGILLDIFVAVFVMGITIYQISREFDNIDSNNLRQLNDMSVEDGHLHKRPGNGTTGAGNRRETDNI